MVRLDVIKMDLKAIQVLLTFTVVPSLLQSQSPRKDFECRKLTVESDPRNKRRQESRMRLHYRAHQIEAVCISGPEDGVNFRLVLHFFSPLLPKPNVFEAFASMLLEKHLARISYTHPDNLGASHPNLVRFAHKHCVHPPLFTIIQSLGRIFYLAHLERRVSCFFRQLCLFLLIMFAFSSFKIKAKIPSRQHLHMCNLRQHPPTHTYTHTTYTANETGG